jgi:transcriptional regulator with XRE-family HTH domain
MLDVSFQQVQKYESGMSKLNTDRLQKIAAAATDPKTILFIHPVFEDHDKSVFARKSFISRCLGTADERCFSRLM